MVIIDNVDDETKTLVYSASILLKMVHLASTEKEWEVNEKIAAGLFGDNKGKAPVSGKDAFGNDDDSNDDSGHQPIGTPINPNLIAVGRTPPNYGPPAPTPPTPPAPWVLASMDLSGYTTPSNADHTSAEAVQEEDWLSGKDVDDKVALLGRAFEALKAQDAQRELEDARQEAEVEPSTTGNVTTAVAQDLSTASFSQMPVEQAQVVNHPSMTLRDLASLVEQYLMAWTVRYSRNNIYYIFELSKAVEIFGVDRFVREPGQPARCCALAPPSSRTCRRHACQVAYFAGYRASRSYMLRSAIQLRTSTRRSGS